MTGRQATAPILQRGQLRPEPCPCLSPTQRAAGRTAQALKCVQAGSQAYLALLTAELSAAPSPAPAGCPIPSSWPGGDVAGAMAPGPARPRSCPARGWDRSAFPRGSTQECLGPMTQRGYRAPWQWLRRALPGTDPLAARASRNVSGGHSGVVKVSAISLGRGDSQGQGQQGPPLTCPVPRGSSTPAL